MKKLYKVVCSTLMLSGNKFVRGDMIELDPMEAEIHGVRLEYIHRPEDEESVAVEEKPKPKPKAKAKVNEAQ